MKLKLFEMFNKDEYYTEISYIEYRDEILSKGKDVGLEWFERIAKRNNGMNVRLSLSTEFPNTRTITIDSKDKIRSSGSPYRSKEEKEMILREKPQLRNYVKIYEIEDEWFIVYTHDDKWPSKDSVMYKCDQFEGLARLLKDLNVIV